MAKEMNLLLVSGSKDSLRLIERFQSKGYKVLVVNTSRHISDSLMKMKGIRIMSGAFSAEDFGRLIENLNISILIDETNPFSTRVSPVLMDAAKTHKIVYCRYEGKIFDTQSKNVIFAKDHEHCIDILNEREGRILLAVGSSELSAYTKVNDYENRLVVKLSPTSDNIKMCESLNIPASNIFAAKSPVSKEFLAALIAEAGASVIVSPDAEEEYAAERRIEAAEESGIPIILINKEKITYINKFRTTDEIARFVEGTAGFTPPENN